MDAKTKVAIIAAAATVTAALLGIIPSFRKPGSADQRPKTNEVSPAVEISGGRDANQQVINGNGNTVINGSGNRITTDNHSSVESHNSSFNSIAISNSSNPTSISTRDTASKVQHDAIATALNVSSSTNPSLPAYSPATTNTPIELGNLLKCRAIIVIRHADKKDNTSDAELSDLGKARAGDLATVLTNAGITKVFVSDKIRTQQTAERLIEVIGKEKFFPILKRDMDGPEVINCVKTNVNDGDIVLIVFHHDPKKLPVLLEGLGDSGQRIADDCFDKMYVFFPNAAKTKLDYCRLHYGSSCGTKHPEFQAAEEKDFGTLLSDARAFCDSHANAVGK